MVNLGTGNTKYVFNCFAKGIFDKEVMTSSDAFGETKTLKCFNDKEVDISLWDIAGQEIYRALNNIFFRDAKVVVLVYNVTSQK